MQLTQDLKTGVEVPLHIIYVDDNPDDAYIFERCVSRIIPPPKFTWLDEGLKLLAYLNKTSQFKTQPKTPEYRVIIIDVNMPELNGFEIIEKIRTETNEEINKIPIVMFSSSNRDEDILRSQSLGAQEYLTKSASFEDAMSTIKEFTLKWRQASNTPLTII